MGKSKKSKFRNDKKKARESTETDRLTVDIDIDVHRVIEAARRSFDESRNAILRRLLKIGARADAGGKPDGGDKGPSRRSPSMRAKSGGAEPGGWSKLDRYGKSIFLPDGAKIRAAYAGKAVHGEIIGGMWIVAGQAYNSPSAALNANVRTRDGNPVNLNGWRHWEVLIPGRSNWVRLNRLEPEAD